MFRVFNMGIGFALVLNPYYVESIQRQLASHHIDSWIIGEVQSGQRGVEYSG
jgi:phosphoribosylaminoimidazole (AIR) synthetase